MLEVMDEHKQSSTLNSLHALKLMRKGENTRVMRLRSMASFIDNVKRGDGRMGLIVNRVERE
jgi:prenyltransferase beta subunit